MSFVRRYQFFPGTEIITLIEGVIIVDLPPPGAINGVGSGTVALVGEFTDMKYAVSVSTSGVVSTSPRPVEAFSAQDMYNKVGGWDETIGEFGVSGGNGFASLQNKRFYRLVLVPINLSSSNGVRVFRQLPTNKSATNPTPIVLLQAGSVAAGREFITSGNRVKLHTAVVFTSTGHYKQAVDGAVVAAGAGVAQLFSSATGGFLTAKDGGPVKAGDLLVLGQIGGAGPLDANADTYRVVADATVATQLTVEKLDGSSWNWTSGTALPYRVHPASDADSGGNVNLAAAGGYLLPARPLNATIAASTIVAPTLVPPAGTATSWDALSGLKLATMPGGSGGLTYTATIQAPNAASADDISALYETAIDTLMQDAPPSRDVNILTVSRHSARIRSKQKAHVLAASATGMGRSTIISPELTTVTIDAAIATSDPGVGGSRHERAWYAWPGALTSIPAAVGYSLKGADGSYHTDGMIDTHADVWLASVLSNLPPERNPGQLAEPIPTVMAPIAGFQRAAPALGINEYVAMRQNGIVGLRNDREVGFIWQSGITTSLTSGEKNINRRRMADFLEDSMARSLAKFSKLPLTKDLKDSMIGECDAFMVGLLSINNPPAQRIEGYTLDDKSGNTPQTSAAGIWVIIAKVRTLATADFITLQVQAGEGVAVTVTAI